MSDPLRIGILIDGWSVPRWQAEVIEAVASEPGIELGLLVVNRVLETQDEPWLFSTYERLDRLIHRGRAAPFTAMDISRRWEDVPTLEAIPRRDSRGCFLAPWDVDHCREQRLDVLVGLGFRGLCGEAATVARYGLWALCWGDGVRYHEDRPGFWEMVDRSPTIGATLQILNERGGGRVIDRTTCESQSFSLVKARSVVVAAAAPMILRGLRRLRDRGSEFLARQSAAEASPASSVAPRKLDDVSMLAPLLRFGLAGARRVIERTLVDEFHWSVAVAPLQSGIPAEALLHRAPFRRLETPAGQFHADPFLFEHEGEEFLFLEAFSYATGRGVIAVSRLDADGRASAPTTVLEHSRHLSYPFVFTWRGEIFMVPETFDSRRVELYSCARFPDLWAPDSVLLEDVSAADSTIVEYDGGLWMFVCLAPLGLSPNTELHLYFADDVRGPWSAHPLNPVVSDVRRARPAGRLWLEDGHLIRPAQDASLRYGYALCFCRILTMTPEDYAEEEVARVTPDALGWLPGARGTHTWNTSSRFCTTDAYIARSRVARWLGR